MASFKALLPCLALLFCLLFSCSQSREFEVGGKGTSWKIPSSPDDFNKWSSKTRFQIGDYIVLEYDANNDSVLEVVESDYNSCNKANPIKAFHDGKTKIHLDRSGPFYFISGADGHCEKGEKLIVRVISPRRGVSSHPSPAPAPAPLVVSNIYAPAPAPANGGHGLKLEIVTSGIALIVASLAAFAFV